MFARDPADGGIVDAFEILRNSEGLRTSGLDLQLDWRFDVGPGELGVNWLVAYLDSSSSSRRRVLRLGAGWNGGT
jgi:hypothetical protein